MFGFRFTRASPTTYVIHYKNGAIAHEGLGLSFFYFAPSSTLVWVPASSVDVPFVLLTRPSADTALQELADQAQTLNLGY